MSSPEPPRAESTTTEPVDLSLSSPHSLQRAVYARRREYTRPHRIRIKVATWNVAACPGTDKDLAGWLASGTGLEAKLASLDLSQNHNSEPDHGSHSVQGETEDATDESVRLVDGTNIGLYVLGLQEVVDLSSATTQVMNRVYAADSSPMEKWKTAMQSAVPEGYSLVTSDQLSGLLLLVYASPEVAPTISNVSTVSVGTGLFGVMGNKGAVTTRIVLGEATKLVFVNCHLASGHEAAFLDRRIWDANQILSRTAFQPLTFAGVTEAQGEKIGDEDFAFWFGDLNFRLDGLPGDDIRRLLMLHTRGEYDLSKTTRREDSLEGEAIVVQRNSESSDEVTDQDSSTTRSTDQATEDTLSLPDPDDFPDDPHGDPASLQATLDSLLPHDQLLRVMKERKLFHDGWREGPITFLPSYKYDVGTVGLFDSSEKRRAPSWCDRVLFRTRKDYQDYQTKVEEEEEARKKDEEMKARGIDQAGDDDEVLFDYDPARDGEEEPQGQAGLDYDEYDEDDDEGLVVTEAGAVDRVQLDLYTSHQRVTSSDHKPVVSLFTLDYDAVVPDLKAKVHAEVARELDRAENEGRPGITIVVDAREQGGSSQASSTSGMDHVVDFGEVRYLQKEISFLTLANTGRVSATFSFVEKPSTEDPDGSSIPQWLSSSFVRSDFDEDSSEERLGKEVTLEPGETVKAMLEVIVEDMFHARMLNDGQSRLEDVLVLRVTDGRDHFIPVHAAWSPTCIGRSIEELIRVPDGGIKVFAKSLADTKGFSGSIPYDLDVRCAAPKELFKLTDAAESLTERVLADAQMLENYQMPESPGWPFEESSWKFTDKARRRSLLIGLIAALDEDKAIADAFLPEITAIERLESVAEVLLLFLRSLTDGIVTMPIWARIEQASLPSIAQPASVPRPATDPVSEDDKAAVLDILGSAPNHNISFVFLTAALTKIIAELSPLSQASLDVLKSGPTGLGLGALGRRSISFRRSGTTPAAEAAAIALEKRQARERRIAEIFGKIVCRAPAPEKEKDKKALEDRQKALLQLFLAKRDDS
ncbi:endonuclease/Exonuclease/phosphatase [Thozetella sp. PMI_491]|nr:endonuclease/Exonuclease/phosphatase [Thozetella sp. PMI_491]